MCEPIGLAEDATDEVASWIAHYGLGPDNYRNRDFAGACFEATLRERPDDEPATLMLDRSRRLARSGADEEWSPIASLTTK